MVVAIVEQNESKVALASSIFQTLLPFTTHPPISSVSVREYWSVRVLYSVRPFSLFALIESKAFVASTILTTQSASLLRDFWALTARMVTELRKTATLLPI